MKKKQKVVPLSVKSVRIVNDAGGECVPKLAFRLNKQCLPEKGSKGESLNADPSFEEESKKKSV